MKNMEEFIKLPVDKAIEQLKRKSTPRGKIELSIENRCKIKASAKILDDWGDSCEGHECTLTKGHSGMHMASDGANGWVYYD